MRSVQNHQNLAPGQINCIDDLLYEGKRRIQTTLIAGFAFGPAVPPAEAYYERAFQIGFPDSDKEHRARHNLGAFLARCYRKEEAIPHLQRAVELKPQNARSRYVLGRLYEDTGRFAEASREFWEAARMIRSPRSLYHALVNYIKVQRERDSIS